MKIKQFQEPNSSDSKLQTSDEKCYRLTNRDLTEDVERIIMKVATPYVSQAHPLLAMDELGGECRLRIAKMIDSGVLSKCLTRAKVFAYIKGKRPANSI